MKRVNPFDAGANIASRRAWRALARAFRQWLADVELFQILQEEIERDRRRRRDRLARHARAKRKGATR